MKKTAFITALLICSISITTSAMAGRTITIAGDPCSLPLAMNLAEAFSKKEPGFSVETKQVGCMLGVYQAANDRADIGVSTQNGLSANLPRGAVNTVLAKAPIVLIVNKKNPVNNLTYKQLQGIYSGKITNWKEVGGKDMEIRNVMLEPCVKHTMSKKVLPYNENISKLKPEKKVNPVIHTNRMVSENEGAMGQQLFGYEGSDVKVLSIDGVLPTEKTVPGSYTFYEEYNFVTPGEPEGIIREFLAFAESAEGRQIILDMKHIPAR